METQIINNDLYVLLKGFDKVKHIADFELSKVIAKNKRRIREEIQSAEEARDQLLFDQENNRRLNEYQEKMNQINEKYAQCDENGNIRYTIKGNRREMVVDTADTNYQHEVDTVYQEYKDVVDKRLQSIQEYNQWLRQPISVELEHIKISVLKDETRDQLTPEILEYLYDIVEFDI